MLISTHHGLLVWYGIFKHCNNEQVVHYPIIQKTRIQSFHTLVKVSGKIMQAWSQVDPSVGTLGSPHKRVFSVSPLLFTCDP
jgi:hypothetical protein